MRLEKRTTVSQQAMAVRIMFTGVLIDRLKNESLSLRHMFCLLYAKSQEA